MSVFLVILNILVAQAIDVHRPTLECMGTVNRLVTVDRGTFLGERFNGNQFSSFNFPKREDYYNDLLRRWNILSIKHLGSGTEKHMTMDEILFWWNEPHRSFHRATHLAAFLTRIEEVAKEFGFSERKKEIWILAALFHDIEFDPLRRDHEKRSGDLFLAVSQNARDKIGRSYAWALINGTDLARTPEGELLQFQWHDMSILDSFSIAELKLWEAEIAWEFRYIDYADYRRRRLAALKAYWETFGESDVRGPRRINQEVYRQLVEHVYYRRANVIIYIGDFSSFLPKHLAELTALELQEDVDSVILLHENPSARYDAVFESEGNPLNLVPALHYHRKGVIAPNKLAYLILRLEAQYQDVKVRRFGEIHSSQFMSPGVPEATNLIVPTWVDRQPGDEPLGHIHQTNPDHPASIAAEVEKWALDFISSSP